MYYLYTFGTLTKSFNVMVCYDKSAFIKHTDGSIEEMTDINYPPAHPSEPHKQYFYAEYMGGDWTEPSYEGNDEYHVAENSEAGWNIKLGTETNSLIISSGGLVPLHESVPGGQSDMFVRCDYINFYEDGAISTICQSIEKFEKDVLRPPRISKVVIKGKNKGHKTK